jgi:SAM-dependent methyltransferase
VTGTIKVSDFLLASPDSGIDHNYLTATEIEKTPVGVYYKKKSVLTRHRFAKACISVDGKSLTFEVIDFKGHWRVDQPTLSGVTTWLRNIPGMDHVRESNLLHACGLQGFVEPMGVAVPAGRTRLPASLAEMAEFYSTYTDMDAQGHFDADSPDLDRLKTIVAWIPEASKVIDVGCNSGAFGAALLEKGCAVAGIDLSPELVEVAKSRGVEAVQGFAEYLPFESNSFDTAICAELLEHVLEPGVVLREVARVLKPGGMLVGSVPHADGDWGHSDIGHHEEHLRAFDDVDLRTLLEAESFEKIDTVEQFHGNTVAQGLAFRCYLADA